MVFQSHLSFNSYYQDLGVDIWVNPICVQKATGLQEIQGDAQAMLDAFEAYGGQ